MATPSMTTPPAYDLQQLADYIGAELKGDHTYSIVGLATLQTASSEQLTFYTNRRYKQYLSTTAAGCVLLSPADADKFQGNRLLIDDPYLAYAKLSALFAPTFTSKLAESATIHPTAVIAEDVILGEGVTVGPHVVIESGSEVGSSSYLGAGCYIGANASIGENVLLHANVTIYHGVTMGRECILHSGCVIGSDGFGFAPSANGWQKIHQLGGVVLGNHVEIGAATTVDRGALDDTIIGDGVIIDNQVQIAHNVHIGDRTAIAAAVAIAGSTVIGKGCTIAGAAGIVGHLSIVDNVHITAMTMVTKSITVAGSYSSGVPMNATREWRKNAARFNQLDTLARQLKSIKK